MEEYEVKYQFNSPVPEDCSTDLVPNGAVNKKGKRVIEVPILTSMTKYLFDNDLGNQRLPMYTFLNRLLRNGSLSRIVGCRVMNKVINRQACEFPDVTYWKISREEFYADVRVHLTLDTPTGTCDWYGVLICSCEFSIDGFFCEIEELTSYVDRESQGLIMLSPFLIPYYKNKMVDEEAEEMWVRHRMEEALTDPSKRDPHRKEAQKEGCGKQPRARLRSSHSHRSERPQRENAAKPRNQVIRHRSIIIPITSRVAATGNLQGYTQKCKSDF